MPKVVYRDLASGRLLTKQEATERDPSTWAVEKFIAPNTSESDERKRWVANVNYFFPWRR